MVLKQEYRAEHWAPILTKLIVLLAIIAVSIGAGSFLDSRMLESVRIARAKKDIEKLDNAVTAYQLKFGYYPESLRTIVELDCCNPGRLKVEDLKDPWGNEYVYERDTRTVNGLTFRIYSQSVQSKKIND